MTRYADILVPLPLSEAFTYLIPSALAEKIQPGMRVLVPFRDRLLSGFVVRTRSRMSKQGIVFKPIVQLLDDSPIFPPYFFSFVEALSRYFFIPQGEILHAAVPPFLLVQTRLRYSLSSQGVQALNSGTLQPAESEVARWLKEKSYTLRFLERKLGLRDTASLLAKMKKKGLILVTKEASGPKKTKMRKTLPASAQLELDFSFDESLRQASLRVSESLSQGRFSPFLIFGQQEKRQALYFDLIRKARLDSGKVLYLIPEIAPASNIVQQIQKRTGEEVVLFHSQLPPSLRRQEWEKVRDPRTGIVLGPHSALFSPIEDLKLIILDEEQDESYDQREGFPFDVRRGAWLRAKEERAVLVQGSSAPTVEAYYRARQGNYLLDLGTKKWEGKVTLVDSRKDAALLSSVLLEKINQKLREKEPILLFFNRRGYAAYLVCAKCGFNPRCQRCGQLLSYHKREEKLVCHSCRLVAGELQACSQCGSRLVEKRSPGIEALAEKLKKVFPQSRIEVFSTNGASRKKEREVLLSSFKRGQIDILLGTNLLARQPELSPVRFVGVLYPEMLLHLADFRASQKAFLAVTKFLSFLWAGSKSEALIQTAAPEHFAIQAAARGDYKSFYEQEIRFRRWLGYPPFSCLAEVVLEGRDARRVAHQMRSFVQEIRKSGREIEVFGPSLVSSTSGKRGPWIRVGLKAKKKKSLDAALNRAWPQVRIKKSIFFFD